MSVGGLESRRKRWIAVIIGAASAQLVLNRVAGDAMWRLCVTDLALVMASAFAAVGCVTTALRARVRPHRIAWLALAGGIAAWWAASVQWSIRELALGEIAPAPSWLDLPFFLLAPSFAVALSFLRAGHGSRALRLRQLADLGIVTCLIAIVGTLVLAEPLQQSDSPYVLVAVGYPGFYLAVVIVALHSLARDDWGSRRTVFGIVIWAQVAFATVDLLYGAKVLLAVYQTGIEDALWLIGFLSMAWAAAEERARAVTDDDVAPVPTTWWSAVVGSVAAVLLVALSAGATDRIDGTEWMIIAIAGSAAAGFVGLRMWTGDRAEHAYLEAVATTEKTRRVLDEERLELSRLRAVGSLAHGTAHEVNNLLQAIGGNLALLRRRVHRGEDIQAYLASIERALARLATQVSQLRELAPTDPARGMVFVLPGGDRDGSLGAVLAEAGFAPATLPDVEAAVRASQHDVYAIVASSDEADQLEARGIGVPVIRRDDADLVDVVVQIVEVTGRRRGSG